MRIGEIILIVALVAGMFLVLAFGFGTDSADSNIGTTALAGSIAGMEYGGGSCSMEGKGSMDCGGSGCADCASADPVLAAFIDFSQDGEYALTGASLKNTGNSLNVFDADGNQIGSFNIGSDGTMVPAAAQPAGNVVKSSYSGPPGDTYSKYRIYPASYDNNKRVTPLMAVDHSYGYVSITHGGDISRKSARSYLKTHSSIGSGHDSSRSSCGTIGGGG